MNMKEAGGVARRRAQKSLPESLRGNAVGERFDSGKNRKKEG